MFRTMLACFIVLGLLAPRTARVGAQPPTPPKLTDEEQQRARAAKRLCKEAEQFNKQGKPAEAAAKYEQALKIHWEIFPKTKYPKGHIELAINHSNLGNTQTAAGRYDRARSSLEQALAMFRDLYPINEHPQGHVNIALCLNNLALVYFYEGDLKQAAVFLEQALEMNRAFYPKAKHPLGHVDLARAINNLGTTLHQAGSLEQARPYFEEALAMYRALFPKDKYPNGEHELGLCFGNVADFHAEMGNHEQAREYYEQSLSILQSLYPKDRFPTGHPALADTLMKIGANWFNVGNPEHARRYQEQALVMVQALFPKPQYPSGHPDIAYCLNVCGRSLMHLGNFDEGRVRFEQALAMYHSLYPAEHPDKAYVLLNLGNHFVQTKDLKKARSYLEQSFEMFQKLYAAHKYPAGHPALPLALGNLASVFRDEGDYRQAQIHYEETLAMYQRLYPKNQHPAGNLHVARTMLNVGGAFWTSGEPQRARTYFEQSLTMHRSLALRFLNTASEGEALAFLQAQPAVLDSSLSLLGLFPGTDAEAFTANWRSRALVTRLLEQRHAAARVAGTEHAPKLGRLRDNRRQTEILLLNNRMKPEDRDKELAVLADQKDALERELAAAIPMRRRWQELDQLGPADLSKALAPRCAFVEIIAYMRHEIDRTQKDKPVFYTSPSYVAFVLPAGGKVKRIELGDASPINSAVAEWRKAIDLRQDTGLVAERIRQLVWSKIAAELPKDTDTLYLVPDGDLARLPWAAIPVAANRVLLEDFAIATVPHGSFLLEHLRFPRSFDSPGHSLAIGGLEYGSGVWPDLPGALAEVKAIQSTVPDGCEVITGTSATSKRVTERLSHVRYAHFATHGEFRAQEFAAEQKRMLDGRLKSQEGTGDSRRIAAKNPLGFVGLVLSHGETISGLTILDLNLDQLKLVTLSACETGLGEYTGGEGVQGLQRAFHLAGCPNVVSSLWKVNDEATMALMAKFYHELWINKKSPIEALREAQLTIYRHPELIKDLAGERGAPKVKEALAVKSASAPRLQNKARTDTKLWAAFGLSGVGR